MVRHRIHVDGMTCQGCETVVSREIDGIDDVTAVTADHRRGVVEFTTANAATGSYVEQAVNDLGYVVTAYDPLEGEH